MRRAFIIVLIFLPMFFSCSKERIIPKNTMKDIYYDMYLADSYLQLNSKTLKTSDSILVYEAIFNKYGYTTEDYNRSVNEYLVRPTKFAKVFVSVQDRLKVKREYLNRDIEKKEGLLRKWDLLDSIRILSSDKVRGNGFYRTINTIFFKPDSVILDFSKIDSSIFDLPLTCYNLYDTLPSLRRDFRSVFKKDTIPSSENKYIMKAKKVKTKNKNKKEAFAPFTINK